MKAFLCKPTFLVGREKALNNFINLVNSLATICEIGEREKLKSVPIMQTGHALIYNANNSSECAIFNHAMKHMREWNNSDDQ